MYVCAGRCGSAVVAGRSTESLARISMRSRTLFLVLAAVHFVTTLLLWFSVGTWQASIAERATTGTIVIVAPDALLLLSWVATAFALPIMLPLLYVANAFGFSTFDDHALYLAIPALNSAVAAWLIVLARNWYISRRAARNAV